MELANQKVRRISGKTKQENAPNFITEDVVEVRRAKMIYYKWISRLMAIVATVSLCYGVMAVLVILTLVPRILIDAQIFTMFSDSESVVRREHIDARMESREKIMVNFMKQYVELRNTFLKDPLEMKKRWMWGGLVSYLSTKQVYQKFAKDYPKLEAEMTEKKASRSVEILSIARSGGEKSYIWKVEFKTYDYNYEEDEDYRSDKQIGPTITEKFWTANMGCRADLRRRIAYRRLINPLGFVVYSYSQSEIEN